MAKGRLMTAMPHYPFGRTSQPAQGAPAVPGDLEELVERLADDPERCRRVVQKLLGEAASRKLGIYAYPEGFKLSVVIPVYNEKTWIREVMRKVQATGIPMEIVLVDDCSTDGTR